MIGSRSDQKTEAPPNHHLIPLLTLRATLLVVPTTFAEPEGPDAEGFADERDDTS